MERYAIKAQDMPDPGPTSVSRLDWGYWQERRTCPYSFTPFIPPPSTLQAEGYLVPEFYSGATDPSGRFTEGFSLQRLPDTATLFLSFSVYFGEIGPPQLTPGVGPKRTGQIGCFREFTRFL